MTRSCFLGIESGIEQLRVKLKKMPEPVYLLFSSYILGLESFASK
jgi:hypothetical protein